MLTIILFLSTLLFSFTGNSFSLSNREAPGEIVIENLLPVEGVEAGYFIKRHQPRLRLLQLKEGAIEGYAEDYFFDRSARYDITVTYVEGSEGTAGLELLFNGKSAGRVVSGTSDGIREHTFSSVDVQKWSRIGLIFTGDGKGSCSFDKLVFKTVGEFKGDLRQLERPRTPRVFMTSREREAGTRIMTDFVGTKMDSLMQERRERLASLDSTAEWEAWQRRTRERLPDFFGEFPEKNPLNPKITGVLDRDGYTIENVIFESQPGYYVTGNFYLPKEREFPVPGIVFTCGHSPVGRLSRLYHEACLGLVLKGYAVIAFDPMGQGERSEYFNSGSDYVTIRSAGDPHLYLGWPTMLLDWTFSGLRVWDGIRAVDYLVSRPEVDTSRIGVVGNSGGGQMSFLIAAVDERIDVCVAAHPGGPQENTYLTGYGQGPHNLADREVLSLIPPRPCRIIVGSESGEIERHRPKYEDLLMFYKGLGCEENLEYTLVDGVHNMKQPKREASYEWFNRWFEKDEEGKTEPDLHPEDPRDLWCTESGSTLISLGGETGQTLNVKRLERIYHPEKDSDLLIQNIASRIGLSVAEGNPPLQPVEEFTFEDVRIEKFTYESEPGIQVPSVLYSPLNSFPEAPVVLYCSERGKPVRFGASDLPFMMASEGYTVLAVDPRGIGESAPVPFVELKPYHFTKEKPLNPSYHYILRSPEYTPSNNCPAFGRTMLGMRTLDVLKGIDFIRSRKDLRGKEILLVGEGSGGIWVLLAAAFDPQVEGVVTLGTLPSYKQIITSQFYNVWKYFWVPGVLHDFDIPDVACLVAPRTQVWIDPIDAMGNRMHPHCASGILDVGEGLSVESTRIGNHVDRIRIIRKQFDPDN